MAEDARHDEQASLQRLIFMTIGSVPRSLDGSATVARSPTRGCA
jgi:hypothetical protein